MDGGHVNRELQRLAGEHHGRDTQALQVRIYVVEPDHGAVAMSQTSDDIESIEETLAILCDPLAMEQVRESERAIAAGEPGTSLADLRARFRAGGPGLEPG